MQWTFPALPSLTMVATRAVRGSLPIHRMWEILFLMLFTLPLQAQGARANHRVNDCATLRLAR